MTTCDSKLPHDPHYFQSLIYDVLPRQAHPARWYYCEGRTAPAPPVPPAVTLGPLPVGFHEDDLLHVALDCVANMREAVNKARAFPWEDYDGDENDPKTDKVTYGQLLGLLQDKLEQQLSQRAERRDWRYAQ